MAFMDSPIVSIPVNGVCYPTDRLNKLLAAKSPVRRLSHTASPPTPPIPVKAIQPIVNKTLENNVRYTIILYLFIIIIFFPF
jgi:hypothetical protein